MLKRKLALTMATGLIVASVISGCVKKDTPQEPPLTTSTETEGTDAEQQTSTAAPATQRPKTGTATQKDIDEQLAPPKKGDTIAIMETTMGTIKIKFFPEVAPKAVENFQTHAKNGYYNNLKFHRVMNDFMIQGGDPNGTGRGGESIWGGTFEDEFSPSRANYRGALSMANSGSDTNGSQFFIVQNKSIDPQALQLLKSNDQSIFEQLGWNKNNFSKEEIAQYEKSGGTPWLDLRHTVFGQVYEGMDTVDKIAAVETDPNTDMPKTDVKIVKIDIKKFE